MPGCLVLHSMVVWQSGSQLVHRGTGVLAEAVGFLGRMGRSQDVDAKSHQQVGCLCSYVVKTCSPYQGSRLSLSLAPGREGSGLFVSTLGDLKHMMGSPGMPHGMKHNQQSLLVMHRSKSIAAKSVPQLVNCVV